MQLFSALQHIHSKNIVHRDIKPENIMFRAAAEKWPQVGAVPVLIDFGMSQLIKPGSAPVTGLMGSPGALQPPCDSSTLSQRAQCIHCNKVQQGGCEKCSEGTL
jgi:serine/threonine protein kinase